jgi:predicted PurR-regulated permease PerM
VRDTSLAENRTALTPLEGTAHAEQAPDITRIVLFVLVVGALLAGSFWTLLPFLSALIWATTITIATWPVLMRLHRLTGRRSAAVTLMTVLVLLTFIVPFALAISTLLDAANRTPALMGDFLARGLGPPPDWVAGVPFVGARVATRWQSIAAGGPSALAEFVQPYALSAASWALAATGGIGRTVVLVLLTVLIIPILYAQGDTAAAGALAFARRLGGDTGARTLVLAGQAIRSVALGVVLTAFVQSLLAGFGLWLCGIPHPGFLTAAVFILGVAQIGAIPVLAPAIIWLFWNGATGWGTTLVIYSIPVALLDNVMRPFLIRRGVELPMLLIVAGVIGGLISFGVVGLFVGPVVLASTYTLAKDWVMRGQTDAASTP